MDESIGSRLKRAWNIFMNRDPTEYQSLGNAYTYRPDRVYLSKGNERSITNAIYNKIALDVAAHPILHVRLDDQGRYSDTIDSKLNECLTLEANLDQTARAFIQDAVLSMFDEGVVALIPVETRFNPNKKGSYEILSLRTGKITEWFPKYIRAEVYNEETGRKETVTVPKKMTAIIENPFYSVMNAPSSTMQRLVRKLNLLDAIDEQSGAGKLDLIIQLPYIIKSDARRAQAEQRRKDIEKQLAGSKYGIAYTDGTEHITQLNRSVDNNLMNQIEYLTSMLYSQLGMSQAILDGTADEQAMLNYTNRIIEPILAAIVGEMNRKFLTRTARSQKQAIQYFTDPFRLVPINNLAEIADKFTRNEIMSSNEIRQIVGMKPSKDPKADELRNSNLSSPKEQETVDIVNEDGKDRQALPDITKRIEEEIQNG